MLNLFVYLVFAFCCVLSYVFLFFKVEGIVVFIILFVLYNIINMFSHYIFYWISQERIFLIKLYLVNINLNFLLIKNYCIAKVIALRNYKIMYHMVASFIKKFILRIKNINKYCFFLNNLFILSLYSNLERYQLWLKRPVYYVIALREFALLIKIFKLLGKNISFLPPKVRLVWPMSIKFD